MKQVGIFGFCGLIVAHVTQLKSDCVVIYDSTEGEHWSQRAPWGRNIKRVKSTWISLIWVLIKKKMHWEIRLSYFNVKISEISLFWLVRKSQMRTHKTKGLRLLTHLWVQICYDKAVLFLNNSFFASKYMNMAQHS